MQIIDGKLTAQTIKEELKQEVTELKTKVGKVPGLVTILVGEDPASQVYVNSKIKTCSQIGILSKQERLSTEISEDELLKLIDKYNNDSDIHGILVQLPLPKHIDEDKVIEAISPEKDVDGFHPTSIGKLVIGTDTFKSCTPYGVMELLKRYKIETKSKHVVVVGRSNIVGKPIANMLVQKEEGANSIVTICHSAAPDISVYTKQADILIAAVGRANLITADMVKDDVVVIDVGINSVDAPNTKKGYKLVGDVNFEEVSKKASYITPVPGGVGPMTIAMLMSNTVKAFKNFIIKN
ncbi:MAG: bifunctional methylenetetrahydrofolate dehydrogenase/methenyltetrahydrofolate cyclohydrolase FolD [Ignavibacteriae bacterium]|nr:MAG: bifunctional methylenetetrahydrofolate dehydrogenase/methenyltetrahydrofolate cyclohydrolase FolD [Ignavibacteriota bacterium]